MSESALVTGGAGFIGSHLVDHLVQHGRRVTVLDDFSTGRIEHLEKALQSGRVELVEGSVLDQSAIEHALDSVTCVYHLAVQCVRRSIGNPIENHEINARGTLNVLEACRRKSISKFIYCSSSEVYGNASDQLLTETDVVCAPTTVYGGAKLAGEHYTHAYRRTYGLATTVVRPFNAYGPREHDRGDLAEVIPRFFIRVLNGRSPIIFGDGDCSRDFTYVADVARGIALVEHCSAMVGRTVNIACGRSVSVLDVAKAVCSACGREDLNPEFHAPRPGDVRTLAADTRLAEAVLGYSATVDLERGLVLYLDWFREQYPDASRLLENDPVNWHLPKAVA